MKKLLSIILSLMMLISVIPTFEIVSYAADLTTGSCGDNVTYSFDSATGTLTISGSGDMTDFSNHTAPWDSQSNNMTSVVIDKGVTSIGSYAFYECYNLKSITVPSTLKKINQWAFYGDNNVENLYISDLKSWCETNIGSSYASPFAWSRKGNVYLNGELITNLVIPNNVNFINPHIFEGCSCLKTVIIEASTTTIGDSAFRSCKNLTGVAIANGPTNIDSFGFSDCDGLEIIVLPNSLQSVAVNSFYNCDAISDIRFCGCEDEWNNITFASGNESLTNSESAVITYNYEFDETIFDDIETGSIGVEVNYSLNNRTGVLTVYGQGEVDSFSQISTSGFKQSPFYGNSKIKTVLISDGVTNISSNLFYNCSKLETIEIPQSVTSIGNNAFAGCSGILEFIVDKNSDKYTTEDGILYNKDKSLIIRYTTALDNSTFDIPESVTKINAYAFDSVNSLTTITLSKNITHIGTYAFYNCSNLLEISIFNSNCDIYDDSYTITSPTKIKACTGSTAETYATKYSRTFESIGHNYVETERVEAKSFTENGYVKSVCSACGNVKKEPLVIYKTVDDGTRFASNDYILPVAKGFVYNNKLYARFDKPIGNFTGIISSYFKFGELTDQETLGLYRNLVFDGTRAWYILGGVRSGDNWVHQYSGGTINPSLLQWCDGEPNNNAGSENQIAITRTNGLLNDSSASSTTSDMGFIACTDLEEIQPSNDCISYFKTNKYVLYNHTMPFSYANLFCQAKGGHLATVADGLENTTISNLIHDKNIQVFLGGYRNTNNVFEWVNGENFNYTTWATGEPNNSSSFGGGQYFIQIYPSGTWDDCCDLDSGKVKQTSGFICEYEPESLSINIDQDSTHTVSNSEIHILANYPDGTSNDITDIATFTKAYINGNCEVTASATKPNGEVIKCTKDIPVEGGHTFVQQTVTNATCTKNGKVANICSICKSRYDNIVPAIGHSYIVSNRVEPTCITDGYVQHTCSICGDKYKETLEVLGHSFGSVPETVGATCTSSGTITYTCSRCGYTQVETIESQGHQYVISESVEPTCTRSGYNTYTCSRCGETYNETTETTLGHSYASTTVSPTCTTKGYTKFTCLVCGVSYQSNYTNALGHSFETYNFNNDSTELFDGTETAKCEKCSVSNTRNVGKTTVFADDITTSSGQEISIPIVIKNNVGLMGLALEFEYDSSKLTPISVTNGELITSGLDDNLEGNAIPGKFKAVWYGTENNSENGVLLYLNFSVNDRAEGNTNITVNYSQEDTFNENFEDVYLECNSINIDIINNSQTTWYQGVLSSTANEVTAGETFCIAIDNSGSNSELTSATHNISFDNTAFTFLGYADANQHLVQTSVVNSSGEITLITRNGHTYNARTPGEVFETLGIKHLLFKANDYAKSGEYNFDYFISEVTDIDDVTATGCTLKINASAISEVANIYIENGLSAEYTDTVTVPVYISNNKGIMGYMINFEYNPEELEIVLAQKGSSFPGNFNDTIGVDEAGMFSVLWNGTDDIAVDGVLMNITFRVLTDEDVISSIKITYSQDDTFNNDYDDVVFNCIGGNIHLNEEESHDYIDEVIAPTPNEKGYTKHTCINCGYSYIDNETDYANDMSALIAALEKVTDYSSEDYSKASYEELQTVYARYLDYPNNSIPQTVIDDATSEILTAISNLVPYLYLTVKAENGTVSVSNYEQDDKYSVLFGETITLTAEATEGYVFDGWYETITKRIRSNETTFTFKITSNTDFEARFIKEQSATLSFENESGWVAGKISKTVSEWSEITTIDNLLPDVPYKIGFTNGRWVYDNATVIQELKSGNNVTITPEYDETNYENPVIPTPLGDEPALDLYYQLDKDNNVGSFTMAAGIPENCQIESIGIAFYYKKASTFNPTSFDLNINNKMITSKFEASNEDGIFTVDIKKFTSYYNWSARGYVTYYDKDGKLKIAYSNQINIINREQIV